MESGRGRRVLVTGAARGIGRAIAEQLASEGAHVELTDRDGGLADDVARGLRERGRSARGSELDVTSADAFESAVERMERDGPIDVLVNNAGIMSLGGFLDQPLSRDRHQLSVNVDGVIHGMRAVLPRMRARRIGHVVNIASAAGRVGTPFAAVYSATKFAVIGLTEAVRAESEGSGVDFTYVMPALVDTELIAGAGRPKWPPVASPTDVARAVSCALRTKQVDVYVPGFARLAAVLPAILPRALYEGVGRLLAVDRLFAAVDEGARAAYSARIREVDPRGPGALEASEGAPSDVGTTPRARP